MVIPKSLRDKLGLASDEVEAIAGESLKESGGRLVIPAAGCPWTTTRSGRCSMPTSGRDRDRLVDTSVAVALLVADHTLPGHAACETFSA